MGRPAGGWPIEIWVSLAGAVAIGVPGCAMGLFYLLAGAAGGGSLGGLVAVIGLGALVVSSGFVASAIAMANWRPGGRILLTAVGLCFVPALPGFLTTIVFPVGPLDPRWWIASVAIAFFVVAPAWMPASSRWFADGAMLRRPH